MFKYFCVGDVNNRKELGYGNYLTCYVTVNVYQFTPVWRQEEPKYIGVRSAGWYWKAYKFVDTETYKIEKYFDKEDLRKQITELIKEKYNLYYELFDLFFYSPKNYLFLLSAEELEEFSKECQVGWRTLESIPEDYYTY